jgi:uncharacterized protein YodC (DUF2158 family)
MRCSFWGCTPGPLSILKQLSRWKSKGLQCRQTSSSIAIQMPLLNRQQKYSREIKPMNLTFCIGDLVRLKSGSPMLMVVDLPEIGVVTCAWRDNGRTFEEGFFTASLIRVPLKNALQRKA